MSDSRTGIEFEIVGATDKAVSGVERLTSSLKRLKSTAAETSKISAVVTEMKKLGSTRISPTVDATKASTGLRRLQSEIEKSAEAIEKYKAKIQALKAWQDKLTFNKARGVFAGDISGAISSSNAQIQSMSETVRMYEMNLEQLTAARDIAMSGETIADSVTDPYREMAAAARESAAGFREAGEAAKKSADKFKLVRSATDSVGVGFKNMLKYAFGIRSMFVLMNRLRRFLVDGVTTLAQYDARTSNTINNLKNSLAGLKGALASAFEPIINLVVPIITKFVDWLTRAMTAVSMLGAMLSGRDYFMKPVVAGASEATEAISDVGSAAKETLHYLASFDEMNVLPSLSDAASGGGGSSGGGTDSTLSFIKEAIDNNGFAGKLALAIDDVLLHWKDLTGEQIAEKIIAGLGALAGGVIGFTIGGVPGAIIGTLAGFTLGLVADSLVFDHDGTLSKDELLGSIAIAAGALAGGLIGFSVGGPGGALLGASIGFGVTLVLTSLVTKKDGDKKFWDGYYSPIDWFMSSVLGLPSDAEIEAWIQDQWGSLKQSVSNFFTDNPIGQGIYNFITNPIGTIGDWLDDCFEQLTKNYHGLKIKVSVVGFEDNIPKKYKQIHDATVHVNSMSDQVKKKIIDGVEANVNSMSDQIKRKYIDNATATVRSMSDQIKKKNIDGVEVTVRSMSDQIKKKNIDNGEVTVRSMSDQVKQKNVDNVTATVRSISDQAKQKTVEVEGVMNTLTNKAKLTKAEVEGVMYSISDQVKKKSIDNVDGILRSLTDQVKSKKIDNIEGVMRTLTDQTKSHKVEVEGNLNSLTDKVKQRVIENLTGVLGSWQKASYWDNNGWNLLSITALLTGWQKSNYWNSNGWNYLGVTALLSGWQKANYWTSNGWNLLNLTAVLTGWQRASNWYANGWGEIALTGVITSWRDTTGAYYQGTLMYKGSGGGYYGGVFKNGKRYPIQNYAGGGSPYGGQIFRARENGNPELVGTLRGSTAVMNNDQIVASVSSGVARAIAGIHFQMTGMPSYDYNDGGESSEDLEEAVYKALMRYSNDSDNTINVESKVNLDGRVVGESSVQYLKSQARQGSFPLAGLA